MARLQQYCVHTGVLFESMLKISPVMQCALLYALLLSQGVPEDHSQLWRMLFQKSLEAASTQEGLDSATDSDTDNSEPDTTATGTD
jgi:hypothetical protein